MPDVYQTEILQYSLYSYVENSPDAIYILDTNKRVVYVNSSFTKMYGWTKEDLNNMKLPHIPPELIEERDRLSQYIDQGTEVFSLDTFRLKKDGELISVSLSITSVKEPAGKIISYVCLSRDVTETKLSEMKYYRLFNQVNDAIYFYQQDHEGKPSKFIDVNEMACQMLGYTKLELLSKSVNDIAHPSLKDKIEDTFSTIIQGRSTFTEWIHITKDGSTKPVEISSRTFKLNNKTMVVSIVRDISERKITEELLRKTESISLIGELSAGIAHEIRNPLTSIRGFVQLLFAQSQLSEKYSDLVISEVDRINSIIGELLLLAKPTSSEFLDKDLITLLKQTVTLLNGQAHLSENEIDLEIYEQEASLYIRCAENKLKQVFINILKNAIEASPPGTEIRVQVCRQKQHVLIRFMDQGKGIPTEILSQIGTPFFTTKSGGTGLGIMISQKIIRDHQGTIQFSSNNLQGTIVEITLPYTYTLE
ncbi:PAS domain-containing sensor histidine kinase [Paenibacillus monticola]|uniref:histidine kinase n=1 Tax=Paenibacillus monticola TaxID=2666075 RepID=A0A7X2KZV6_9BACL|nr:PAS domain-containing sensor histidine kinase [Paenibacillus monticola]MRN51639.1 PAS domain S-box protein [Paenibacillus monticola]